MRIIPTILTVALFTLTACVPEDTANPAEDIADRSLCGGGCRSEPSELEVEFQAAVEEVDEICGRDDDCATTACILGVCGGCTASQYGTYCSFEVGSATCDGWCTVHR